MNDEEIINKVYAGGANTFQEFGLECINLARQDEQEKLNNKEFFLGEMEKMKCFDEGKQAGREEREKESASMLAQTVINENTKEQQDKIASLETIITEAKAENDDLRGELKDIHEQFKCSCEYGCRKAGDIACHQLCAMCCVSHNIQLQDKNKELEQQLKDKETNFGAYDQGWKHGANSRNEEMKKLQLALEEIKRQFVCSHCHYCEKIAKQALSKSEKKEKEGK